MARKSKVDELPGEVRAWLDKALVAENFSGYEALEEAMRERGCTISKSAIHRYGQKIERRFAAIKASTEAARLLTEGAADDQDARSEAVIALVQTELFESIINLQEATDEEMEPAERINLLSKAAKNIATLSRASVNLKKYQADLRERAATAAAKVGDMVKRAGLSDDAVQKIRAEILGVVDQ